MRRTLWMVLVCSAACGGKAVIDVELTDGSGGGSNTTTLSGPTTSVGGNSPTTSTSVGGGQPECPPVEPTCPIAPPAPGTPCPCEQNLFCEYDECPTVGSINGYMCDGTWAYTTAGMCSQPMCPNGIFCDIGEVCLMHDTGAMVSFECAPNICAPTFPPDCDCAQGLCDDDYVCGFTNDTSVTCECVDC